MAKNHVNHCPISMSVGVVTYFVLELLEFCIAVLVILVECRHTLLPPFLVILVECGPTHCLPLISWRSFLTLLFDGARFLLGRFRCFLYESFLYSYFLFISRSFTISCTSSLYVDSFKTHYIFLYLLHRLSNFTLTL
jgi:hypothetical protein